ncbi:Interleukin-17 receptor C [Bagarius yarrelli]|uniref:Interleukin-17 receptor C n=1 Tax=Bagarius yarrelli TaxID=175774 RepID=A0A556VTX7_BAGYA|nr:Interleukin-17 receptor C [Bagarius yarrelli]
MQVGNQAMSVLWRSLFLLLTGAVVCKADLKTYDWQSDITCSQALNRCSVVDKNCVLPPCAGALPPCTSTTPEVSSVSLEPALCSKTTTDHQVCLLIRIRLRVPTDDNDEVSGETPDDLEDEDCAALTLCYIFAPNLPSCKEITFSLISSALRNQEEPEVRVVVQDRSFLGSLVNVTVNGVSQEVRFPNVKAAPKLSAVIDQHKGLLELKAENEEPLLVCVKKNEISHCWTSGEFLDVTTENIQFRCVMFKVDGETFGPVCKHYTPRVRWICLPIITMLFVVLFTVGVCVLRFRHKGEEIQKLLQLTWQCVLVLAPQEPQGSADVIQLGFSVSLDLWNKAEVGNLGPTPWLHSRLQHVQRHGGKTLLLLSHEAVCRVEDYYETWSGASNAGTAGETSCPWSADVFSSALSSLFSARLQGGAAEHFVLVQLGCELIEMPKLLYGLKLYQLPSESQQLLTDLHTVQPGSLKARLKKFLWTWKASARLEKKLRNCERERRPRTESTLTHMETLSIDKDMEKEETQHLKD